MEGKTVVTPIYPDTLSYRYKRKALEEVNLIKEKRKGKMKERTCVDGNNQENYLK